MRNGMGRQLPRRDAALPEDGEAVRRAGFAWAKGEPLPPELRGAAGHPRRGIPCGT